MIAMMIEGLVALLLVLTIGYCVVLNGRLKRLRSDEDNLRGTIAELVTATEIAERAVRALKTTLGEADKALGSKLQSAETVADELARLLEAADGIRSRPAQPVQPVQPVRPVAAPPAAAPVRDDGRAPTDRWPGEPRAADAVPAPASPPPRFNGFASRPAFAARR